MKRVLIANRGEIAVRIIKTLTRMGIESVAVYSEADRNSPHIEMADHAVALGGHTPADSYLQINKVLDAAVQTNADAIHPGYGLLSESPEFASRCAELDLIFIGPDASHLSMFGKKHTARQLAEQADMPLIPGTGLLDSLADALAAADEVGYPVILKASAGGGGIGMRKCTDAQALTQAFDNVRHLAEGNFGDASVFLERFVQNARHIEVQVFGDGAGQTLSLGERDCSAQRRNQKVIEETPAPKISEQLRSRLKRDAVRLCNSVEYKSAGTVEYVVDADSLDDPDGGSAWFLEVNTRLQVEHGVTELTHGVDLVEWMILLADNQPLPFFANPPKPRGHAIQARVYAEDPADDFKPSPGLITDFSLPDNARTDTWVERGSEVSPFYDPLLAKVMVYAETRELARQALLEALDQTRIGGIETNLALLSDLVETADFCAGTTTTHTIADMRHAPSTVKVLDGGLFTTVQDLPGRLGYWQVGVPPSGPMDDQSFRLANELLGNDPCSAGLEITLRGPTLRFSRTTAFVLGGAGINAALVVNGDHRPVTQWTVIEAPAGAVLELGTIEGPGARSYLAVSGGIKVPEHLGSKSTFVLGGFGGHGGRTLRAGDVLHLATADTVPEVGAQASTNSQPRLSHEWEVEVLPGPHTSPDYFTPADIEDFYSATWEVHFNSDRTGIRLIGPTPQWARPDGGEAGLHPSNIHDNAYAIGAIDFTGDMPIVLGKDGPSLGGFVCPATVAEHDFWKIGQARAGDKIRFVPRAGINADPVLVDLPVEAERPMLKIRRAGDSHVLVEYGENVLDLMLRIRVSALMDALERDAHPAVLEQVPGIRSLQVGFDPAKASAEDLARHIEALDLALPDMSDLSVPSRIVRLPLSWDDPATQLATEKYMQTVRADAPWCPWNLEFIRRINGLTSVDDVKDIVFDASYLVLGLGDVYLGAPVATPIDPRHRLVTTKYNPARTWTAENSVGIGGAYMCIYGMEGPGGYQFVGRTVPIWHRWAKPDNTAFKKPWLLRFFDQIQWYPVDADELLEIRNEVNAGRFEFDIQDTTFSVSGYLNMLEENRAGIAEFEQQRTTAFNQERARWKQDGIDLSASMEVPATTHQERVLETDQFAVTAPIPGVVWKLCGGLDDSLAASSEALILESMKMETPVSVPHDCKIVEILCEEGQQVQAGDMLMIVER